MQPNALRHRMKDLRKCKLGQSTLPEYVLLMFVVIGAAVMITTYVQRSLQARVFDARNYAINQLKSECDGNCLAATGEAISREYEPYYGRIVSNTDRATQDFSSIQGGVANFQRPDGVEGIYRKRTDIESTTQTISQQLPPKDANGND